MPGCWESERAPPGEALPDFPDHGLPAAWLLQARADLLVLNKPAGLLCQPGLGPEKADSLISRVQQRWPQARLVHRLDQATSGLILVALSAELHRELSRLFAQRLVQKHYCADVVGLPAAREGSITLPIAKRQHRPPLYGVDPAGKPCCTHWRQLAVLEPPGAMGPGRSRLRLQPVTGRSHQLRVHLKAIGHPIVGDELYGLPMARPAAEPERLRLHATELAFQHPFSAEPLRFTSVCPF